LIEWSGYIGQNHTIGSARITGSGIDAVERGSSPSIEIRFPEAPKRSFIQELEERKRSQSSSQQATLRQWSRKIFIVHGHDNEAKVEVARFLERVGFEAIILHEQANRGRTIIEKVEMHSDVGFAVVLLTPDDEGGKRGNSTRPRARQNVVLELGYFIGRLGRDRVAR
jgi:predicted nucleotide-binding protein